MIILFFVNNIAGVHTDWRTTKTEYVVNFVDGKKERGILPRRRQNSCFNIGRTRIHVERENERINNYDILIHKQAQYRHLVTKTFQVYMFCCLVNVQAPLFIRKLQINIGPKMQSSKSVVFFIRPSLC